MNIFILDIDPRKAAQYHCDKHVIKMILETAQLLCTAHWETGGEAPYKNTHKNHPCAKWTRESISNYKWLCRLGIELCGEYTHRYNKRHKTEDIIIWCTENIPNIPNVEQTNFVLAMPDYYKKEEAVDSYRSYYNGAKKHMYSWKNRKRPEWTEEKEKL